MIILACQIISITVGLAIFFDGLLERWSAQEDWMYMWRVTND